MKKLRRPSFTLLEVLIALALIVGCMIPLIYPHVVLLQAQNAFVSEMKIDRVVQNLYGETLVRLYRNEIAWSDIESGKDVAIDPEVLAQGGIPKGLFSGKYRLKVKTNKPKPPAARTAYLLELSFEFDFLQQKRPPLTYVYKIFVERNLSKEEAPAEEAPAEDAGEEES